MASEPKMVEKTGVLWKRSRMGFFWNRRSVRVYDRQLQYQNSSSSASSHHHPKQQISLEFATVEAKPSNGRKYPFEVATTAGTRLEFAAETSQGRQEWMHFIRQQIDACDERGMNRDRRGSGPEAMERETPDYGDDQAESEEQDVRFIDGIEAPEQNESWNATYQSVMEMEDDTLNMSIAKARRMANLIHDFVQTSQLLGRTIIAEYTLPMHLKTIVPIDQQQQQSSHFDMDSNSMHPENYTYMAQGIVFQFSQEPNGSGSEDRAKMKEANHDLHGTAAYANASVHVKGLHTSLCCTVDYMGFRLFAIAFVPIYDDTRVAFGHAPDALTAELIMDDQAVDLLERCAAELNLAPHRVVPAPRCQPVAIYTSPDVQVHRGNDSRLYITGLARVMPANVTKAPALSSNSEDPWWIRQLRHEYVHSYSEALSPNAFRNDVVPTLAADEAVRKAGIRLRQERIAAVVQTLDMLEFVPLDALELETFLHEQGVNMHLLGLIAKRTRLPHVREMVVCDMVARAAKQLLRTNLRRLVRSHGQHQHRPNRSKMYPVGTRHPAGDEEQDKRLVRAAQTLHSQLREGVVQLFNLILGSGSDVSAFWQGPLREAVQLGFEYELGAEEGRRLHRPLLFQALQQHCGVAFSTAGMTDQLGSLRKGNCYPAFQSADLIAVEARCKYHPVSWFKYNGFMETFKQVTSDNAIKALSLRLELLDLVQGNHGQQSTEAAQASQLRFRDQWELHRTLSQLCGAYLSRGRHGEAKACCRRILETVESDPIAFAWLQGQTVLTYLNLASIYMAEQGNEELVRDSFQLALRQLKQLYGPHHPLIINLHDAMASTLCEVKAYQEAEQHYRKAIDLALTGLGKSHPVTAKYYTRLGNMYYLEHNLELAKDAHEKACLIFEGLYGPASLEVARSCYYLSDILAKRGDLDSAHYYNQRALKIREQLLGPKDELTLESYLQVALQASKRDDGVEGIPYFEKLLAHYKEMLGGTRPDALDAEILREVMRWTKSIIRLKVRALTADQTANLKQLYNESRDQLENSALKECVMQKLYNDKPSEYMTDLLARSSKGVAAPGYASAKAELAIVLQLMDNEDDDEDEEEEAELNENLNNILQREGSRSAFSENLEAKDGIENIEPTKKKSHFVAEGESFVQKKISSFEKPNTIVES